MAGRRRVTAIGIVVLMLLGSCSDDEGGEPAASDVGELECITPSSGDPVKVAVVWPEGPALAVPELEDSARAAAAYGSDCLGGIGGRPIEVFPCPIDEANPASATECANRAVEEGVIAFAVTITGTGSTMVPIVTGAGIPYVSFSAVAPQETLDSTGLVFSITGGAAAIAGAFAQTSDERDVDRLAVLVSAVTVANASGVPLPDPFEEAGVEVELILVPPGTADVTPQVSAALSGGADATAMVGDATLCISYLQAVQAVDPEGEHWITSTCSAPDVVEAVGEEALEDATEFVTAYGLGDDPESRLYQQVMATYAPDIPLGGFTAAGYTAVLGLIRGVTGLGADVTPGAIASAMGATRDVPQPAGYGATFGCADEPIPELTAICGSQVIVATIVDGRETAVHLVDGAALYEGG